MAAFTEKGNGSRRASGPIFAVACDRRSTDVASRTVPSFTRVESKFSLDRLVPPK